MYSPPRRTQTTGKLARKSQPQPRIGALRAPARQASALLASDLQAFNGNILGEFFTLNLSLKIYQKSSRNGTWGVPGKLFEASQSGRFLRRDDDDNYYHYLYHYQSQKLARNRLQFSRQSIEK